MGVKPTLDVCVVLVLQENIVLMSWLVFVNLYLPPSLCIPVTKGTYMERKFIFKTTKLRLGGTIHWYKHCYYIDFLWNRINIHFFSFTNLLIGINTTYVLINKVLKPCRAKFNIVHCNHYLDLIYFPFFCYVVLQISKFLYYVTKYTK